jgi:hypothetical protein
MRLEEKPPSDEHLIPTALGGALIIDRVCKDCNDKFGQQADAGLEKQYQIEQRRIEHGLKGQSGSLPDPSRRLLGILFPGRATRTIKLVRREPGTSKLESENDT